LETYDLTLKYKTTAWFPLAYVSVRRKHGTNNICW